MLKLNFTNKFIICKNFIKIMKIFINMKYYKTKVIPYI